MDRSAPIGIFDSGIGGLSVWNELVREMPHEKVIYVADSAHAPYGSKSRSYITGRSRAITGFLKSEGCKLVVVACNTATGASISTLRREFDIPFVGVEPAVKPAAMESRSGHVGVLATARTFKGEHFKRSIKLYARSVEIHERVGAGLVELVENGKANSKETEELLSDYLTPMVAQGIDQLVLGCTHYPFLIPVIRKILPAGIRIIDPAPAVASQAKRVLEGLNLLNSGSTDAGYRFFTTGDPAKFGRVLAELTGVQYTVNRLAGLPLVVEG